LTDVYFNSLSDTELWNFALQKLHFKGCWQAVYNHFWDGRSQEIHQDNSWWVNVEIIKI